MQPLPLLEKWLEGRPSPRACPQELAVSRGSWPDVLGAESIVGVQWGGGALV